MKRICLAAAGLSLVLSGAIFGFFYAWVCSTMWGLDAADPRIAIAAMQAMNGSVRNAVFAPAFFATPVVLALTGLLALRLNARGAGFAFLGGGLLYFLGGLVLTMRFNVPMNEALALVRVPDSLEEARAIWQAYSPTWQAFNQTRTVVSGLTLIATGYGIWRLGRDLPFAPADR